MNKTILKYLIISIVFADAWILIEHVLGLNTIHHEIGQFTRNLPMVFFWITIFLVISEVKRRQGNQLTFSQGFKTGLLYTVLFSLAFAIIILLYVKLINPEFYASYKEFTRNQLITTHATPRQIKAAMQEVDISYNGTLKSYALLFLFSSIFGIVISLIASMVFRTKKSA